MQHTASAKLKLSKSHLSRVPQKTKCTLIQHKHKLSGKQTCGLNTRNGAREPFLVLLGLEKVHDNSHSDVGK